MNKEKIISSIVYEGKFQLKPSTVCDGVGVFALVDIPYNIILFNDVVSDQTFISWEEIPEVDSKIVSYLKSICNSNDKGIYLNRTVNNICIPYYINHSENFNVKHFKDDDVYVTSRPIKAGDEILCYYNDAEIDW